MAAAITGSAIALLVVGCGSAPAPTHFHTLMPPASDVAERGSAGEAIAWQLLAVTIPAQVDQPQWVLRTADGSLVVLEQERWIAPLADELRGAVVERLTKSLGPPQAGSSDSGAAAWRIGIDVQRFELIPDREARLEADWWLRGSGKAVSCHGTFSQPVSGPGYVLLARAQQQAVAGLADVIAAAVAASSKGMEPGCR